MNTALRAEFRKLFTVRSTYVLSCIALLLVAIGSFYGSGFKAGLYDQHYLASTFNSTATTISFFGAVVSVLLMAHEYRYSTIVYTLTLNKSRSKVLIAKVVAVLSYVISLTVLAFLLDIGLALLGAQIAGHHVPHQEFNLGLIMAKSIFYCSGFALAGLLFTVLIRNLTASITVLFIVPSTIEGLIGMLLKSNAAYLPFTALQAVLISKAHRITKGSPEHGAIVFTVYMVVTGFIAWQLFLRRDSN